MLAANRAAEAHAQRQKKDKAQTVNWLQTIPVDFLVFQLHNDETQKQYGRLDCLSSPL